MSMSGEAQGGAQRPAPTDRLDGLRREIDIGLRLAPSQPSAVAAFRALAAYLDADPRVAVRLAGLSMEGPRVLLTVAITLGTVEEVKVAAPRTRAALSLLQRIVDDLAAYDPCLATLPARDSAEARAAGYLSAHGAAVLVGTAP
jgi:hypothetical protein